MKNSTLLRLFFISIGLPLTCASFSAHFCPYFLYLILLYLRHLRPKSKPASPLGTPPIAHRLSNLRVLGLRYLTSLERSRVSGIEDAVPEELEALIGSRDYEQITQAC